MKNLLQVKQRLVCLTLMSLFLFTESSFAKQPVVGQEIKPQKLRDVTSVPAVLVSAPAEVPAGSNGRFLQLAMVKGKRVQVTVNGNTSATVNGVTISSLAVNGAGAVRALVSTSCRAKNAKFTLRAIEGKGWAAETTLTVTVTSNPSPALVYENAHLVAPEGTLTIKPLNGPSDQGLVASVAIRRVSPNFRGLISVNQQGIVTISRAPARGSYNVTIRTTDNCGAYRDASFTLAVGVSGNANDNKLRQDDPQLPDHASTATPAPTAIKVTDEPKQKPAADEPKERKKRGAKSANEK